jgi:tetratricopeptide (TPR) repeat protein
MVVVMTTIAEAQDNAATRLRGAYELAYNLDHEEAVREMQAVAKLSPELSTTYRALASVTWLRYLFGRGTVLVDEYLGRISKRDVSTAAAPPEVADNFRNYLSTAIRLAEQRVAQHPRDPRALYELSSALGLQASWAATVEGRMSRAFGSARRAYRIAEHASTASPAAVEPRLVLGTYRYVVAGLNLPARMVAFMAGMDGDRAKGLQLVEEAARADDSAVQTEARFALVLLYNREKRWDDAMAVLADLRRAYPRNRLLWLETGSTALRAGRPGEADRWLTEGLAMCGRDDRRRMFGEDALWRYKRGTARLRLQRPAEAREDLLASLAAPEARDWVRGRSHLELADASVALGDRAQARWQAGKAIPLLERGQDAEGVRIAKRLLERLGRD